MKKTVEESIFHTIGEAFNRVLEFVTRLGVDFWNGINLFIEKLGEFANFISEIANPLNMILGLFSKVFCVFVPFSGEECFSGRYIMESISGRPPTKPHNMLRAGMYAQGSSRTFSGGLST